MPKLLMALVFVCGITCQRAVAAPEAYVYISANENTYAYDAASSGKLTPIHGSPFKTVGTMLGTNGTFIVTLSTDSVSTVTLLSYEVAANGGIGKFVDSVNTQLYAGPQCGPAGGGYTQAAFDHAGQNVHVMLSDYNFTCDAIQTYGLSKNGMFTFKGDTEFQEYEYNAHQTFPVFTGNGKFGYGFQAYGYDEASCAPVLTSFRSISGDVVEFNDGQLNSPAPPLAYDGWQLIPVLTDDSTDHMVVVLEGSSTVDCEDGGGTVDYGPVQLGSFTPDNFGNLNSTNTSENMPAVEGYPGPAGGPLPSSIRLNRSGKVLAVAVDTGVQFFHFNGANPITNFTGLIGNSGQITHMAWDSQNHLYALNSSGRLHVYDVTSASVKELSGSRTVVPLGDLVVRSK